VALHIVLGNGEMTKREMTTTLSDLSDRAGEDNESFWFILQGKPEPTTTDLAMLDWLHRNEVYYEVVTDDEDSLAEDYQPQKVYAAKRLEAKIVNLLKTAPEDDESASVLCLFSDVENPEAEEDRWLNNLLNGVGEAGFKAYGMNDGMAEIELGGGEAEPEPAAAPVKKAAKRAAAAPSRSAPQEYSRDELEALTLDEVKAIAAGQGIELPARTRQATYIQDILNAQEGESASEHARQIVTESDDEEVIVSGEAEVTGITSTGMVIVMMNGTVTAMPVSSEQAAAIIGGL
jgi:hypothetical protein